MITVIILLIVHFVEKQCSGTMKTKMAFQDTVGIVVQICGKAVQNE